MDDVSKRCRCNDLVPNPVSTIWSMVSRNPLPVTSVAWKNTGFCEARETSSERDRQFKNHETSSEHDRQSELTSVV